MLNASITDLVFVLKTPTTAADVNAMLKAASEEGPLAASAEHGDILGYESNPNPNPNLTLPLPLTLPLTR